MKLLKKIFAMAGLLLLMTISGAAYAVGTVDTSIVDPVIDKFESAGLTAAAIVIAGITAYLLITAARWGWAMVRKMSG